MFFGKGSSEILSLLWNNFQENIHLYMGFSEYKSTEELLKSFEEYIFNKRYKHNTVDLVLVLLPKIFQIWAFIFEESLTNSPRGMVGEKYNRCINVLKRGNHYNLIVVNEKECEKAKSRLHNPYSCSILLFNIFFVLYSQKLYQKDVDFSSHFHNLHKSYGKDRPLGNLGTGISIGIWIYSPLKSGVAYLYPQKTWENLKLHRYKSVMCSFAKRCYKIVIKRNSSANRLLEVTKGIARLQQNALDKLHFSDPNSEQV